MGLPPVDWKEEEEQAFEAVRVIDDSRPVCFQLSNGTVLTVTNRSDASLSIEASEGQILFVPSSPTMVYVLCAPQEAEETNEENPGS